MDHEFERWRRHQDNAEIDRLESQIINLHTHIAELQIKIEELKAKENYDDYINDDGI